MAIRLEEIVIKVPENVDLFKSDEESEKQLVENVVPAIMDFIKKRRQTWAEAGRDTPAETKQLLMTETYSSRGWWFT